MKYPDYHLEIWVEGKKEPDETAVIYVASYEYDGEAIREPISLSTIKACINFVRDTFPNGWCVKDDGTIQERRITHG